MDSIKVVCALIFRESKIFICRRKRNKVLGGYWEFPGGKIELKEMAEETVVRELIEELNINVNVVKHFMTVNFNYPHGTVELYSFICQFNKSEIQLNDHDDFKWIEVNELDNFNLAPADVKIAKALMHQL